MLRHQRIHRRTRAQMNSLNTPLPPHTRALANALRGKLVCWCAIHRPIQIYISGVKGVMDWTKADVFGTTDCELANIEILWANAYWELVPMSGIIWQQMAMQSVRVPTLDAIYYPLSRKKVTAMYFWRTSFPIRSEPFGGSRRTHTHTHTDPNRVRLRVAKWKINHFLSGAIILHFFFHFGTSVHCCSANPRQQRRSGQRLWVCELVAHWFHWAVRTISILGSDSCTADVRFVLRMLALRWRLVWTNAGKLNEKLKDLAFTIS